MQPARFVLPRTAGRTDNHQSEPRASSRLHFIVELCIVILIIVSLVLVLSLPAHADSSFPSVESYARNLIRNHHSASALRVIVEADPSALSGPGSAGAAGRLVHGFIRGVAPSGGFITADVTPDEAIALSQRPGVRHVSFDWPVASTGAAMDGPGGSNNPRNFANPCLNIQRSFAQAIWKAGPEGVGVGVAVVDSGIANDPDLSGRIAAWKDFVNAKPAPYDDFGHGTHVAGIVAGNGSLSAPYTVFQFPGVAPYANLIGVKVLDSTGAGQSSTVIQGIDWCIQNAAKYNIRVINLSLGHPVYESYNTDPLCLEVEKAWQAGIVVVVAAGNDGRLNANPTAGVADNDGYGTCYGSIESPGNDPYVITVGAMKAVDLSRADDYIATYSSRGPTLGDNLLKPDIVAYGNLVASLYDSQGALDQTYTANQIQPALVGGHGPIQYFVLSGTSMATPAVSGAAALMLEGNSSLSPDTVKLRLMLSADKWGSDAFTYGAGYLDIPAAMANTAVARSPMLSPELYQGSDGYVYLANPTGSEQLVFGGAALWGGRAFRALDCLAGSDIVSGDAALWGGRAAWGYSGIWGKDTTEATVFGDGGDL